MKGEEKKGLAEDFGTQEGHYRSPGLFLFCLFVFTSYTGLGVEANNPQMLKGTSRQVPN
jgi:hypothetical protein